jgi:hypothetical protein
MTTYLVAIRSKDGEIEHVTIEGNALLISKEATHCKIEGSGQGQEVIINFDGLVYVGPSDMIKR